MLIKSLLVCLTYRRDNDGVTTPHWKCVPRWHHYQHACNNGDIVAQKLCFGLVLGSSRRALHMHETHCMTSILPIGLLQGVTEPHLPAGLLFEQTCNHIWVCSTDVAVSHRTKATNQDHTNTTLVWHSPYVVCRPVG